MMKLEKEFKLYKKIQNKKKITIKIIKIKINIKNIFEF